MEEESEPGNEDASYLEKQDIPHPCPCIRELILLLSAPRMIHGECAVSCANLKTTSFWCSTTLHQIWTNTYR